MMGRQRRDQGRLFYEFRLDDHVPADHLLRRIDRFLDLASVRSELEAVLQRHRPALCKSSRRQGTPLGAHGSGTGQDAGALLLGQVHLRRLDVLLAVLLGDGCRTPVLVLVHPGI